MAGSLGGIAELALSHDPAAALVAIGDHLHEPTPTTDAVVAFVRVLMCDFDAASSWQPEDDDPLTLAVAGFVAAVCLAQMPSEVPAIDPASPYAGLHAFVSVEAAMSGGQITRAEELARAAEPALEDLADGTYWGWNRVALSRALAFQGRFTEAREAIDAALNDPRRHAWPAVDRIARGVRAFVAANEGDPAPTAAYVASLRAELPAPRSYLESAAFVLAAFAAQATGEHDAIEELAVFGGGGDYLPRYQIVDRIYAYENLIESALGRGDVPAARRWLELAEALPTEQHDMASALVARGRARIALALDDPHTGALESGRSEERAALVGGSLEVFRAQLLQAVASRAQGAEVDVGQLEQVALLAARTGARVVRAWAVRELAVQGRRLRNVPGQGWDALTDRQRLVAVLAAQGLRNREIGAQLFVSERTIEGHVAAVLDALGAPSRVGIGRHIPGAPTADAGDVRLTPRQQAVADLVAEGRSNAAIAQDLGISEKTVEKHVSDLFVRLGVQSRAGIAALVRGRVP